LERPVSRQSIGTSTNPCAAEREREEELQVEEPAPLAERGQERSDPRGAEVLQAALRAALARARPAILRRIVHAPPDRAWPEIDRVLSTRPGMRPEPGAGGYDWVSSDVRVRIAPLSRFEAVPEPALVVVEPRVWSPEELASILERVRTGAVRSDLLVIIRGSESEVDAFRRALAAAPP
jgi:hypothetical protein